MQLTRPPEEEGQRAETLGDGADNRAVMARALAYLFAAGGGLALASLVVPKAGEVDTLTFGPVELICTAATILLTAALFMAPRQMHSWAYGLILACGTAMVTTAMLVAEGTSTYAVLYVLVAFYAAYFFGRLHAAGQVALIGVAYATVVAANETTQPLARWLTTVGTLVVVAAMVQVLKGRVERLLVQLRDAARTDSLTGLLNRRGFEDIFEHEMDRALRNERPISLVMGDIDHFKALNDTHGHKAGDRALEGVSASLNEHKRKMDTAARVGGEEFALLLPEADEHAAYMVAERLRQKIRAAFATHDPPVTISFGIATYPLHGATAESLMIAGDQALYAAKELGRDRSVIYNPEISSALAGESTRRLAQEETYLSTVLALAAALDVREHGSTQHSQAVGHYAELIARELGVPEPDVERVRIGGVLHDIGEIGVPDAILSKPGPLSEHEWREVHRHPEVAARMLRSAPVRDIGTWILGHHERPDGAGYPNGLRGEEIPLEARILAVAEAYQAMRSDRSYRPALTPEEAREQLQTGAGTQFDQAAVTALLRVVARQGEVSLAP